MKLLKIKLALIAPILALQVGCASITGSRNQPISVTTTHEGKPVIGVNCTLVNDKGAWYVSTPGSVVIQKSYGDMSATCKKEETHVGVATFQSANEGSVWGNVIAGGLIGYAVDASSGAGFSYPPTLNIELIMSNTIPTASTGQQSATLPSQSTPNAIATTSKAPVSTPNPAKKLDELNTMLKKDLITQDEYNSKKIEILKTL